MFDFLFYYDLSGGIVGLILYIALRVFALYDGYKSCKINNELWYRYLEY